MTADVQHRESPGVRKSVRMAWHQAAFCAVDPDSMRAEVPPPEVQSQLLDIFGEERLKTLKVRLHPFLKRWCLFERQFFPEINENYWRVVSIFCEPAEENKIPTDYVGNRFLESYSRYIGEFSVPNRIDFETIEKTDKKKYTIETREKWLDRKDDEARRQYDCEFEAREHDFWGYYFNAFADAQNRIEGTGWHMRSTPTVALFSNKERWYWHDHGSYKEKVKVGSKRYNELTLEKVPDEWSKESFINGGILEPAMVLAGGTQKGQSSRGTPGSV